MKDTSQHDPGTNEFNIDRPMVRRYLRASSLLGYVGFFGGFGLMMAIGPIIEGFENGGIVWLVPGLVVGGSFLIGLLGYLIFGHFRATRIAEGNRLHVEGDFIIVDREHGMSSETRRIHFRVATDYGYRQNWLMKRLGLYELMIYTTGLSTTLLGVKNAPKVCAELARLDCERG